MVTSRETPKQDGYAVPRRALWVVAGAAAVVGFLWVVTDEAEATHLRGGTMFWRTVNVTVNGLGQPTGWDVEVTGTVNWRLGTWPGGTTVGTTRIIGTLNYGDGATTNFCERAIIVDAPRDWLVAEMKAPDCTNNLRHVYTTQAPGSWTVFYSICCRISLGGSSLPWYHINNPDATQRLETTVNLPAPSLPAPTFSSPRAFIPPIVDCPINNICYVPIAAWDPENDPLTYTWATAAQATGGGGFDQPGPPDASNAAVIQTAPAPQIVWNTNGANIRTQCFSVYSAQIRVGDGRTTVPVDWFLNLCPDEPPYWVDPPSPCVHLGHPYVQFISGIMNSYTVEARHNISSRMVSMFLSPITPLPPGATQTFPSPGNPISSTLFWNPDVSLTGMSFPVSYYAYSGSSYAPICTVIIRVVSQPPVPVFVCATPQSPYLRVLFDEASTDPDSNIATWEWTFGDGTSQTYTTPTDPFHDYPAKGWYDVTLNVTDTTGAYAGLTKRCYAHNNDPPILDPIGDKTVYEESTLTFTISGRDPDNDPVGFYWARGPLPAGARFDPQQLLFTWTPVRGMRGEYEPVHFRIVELTSDARYDWENIRITVLPIPDPVAPVNSDSDGDGVPERHDDCPNVPNPGQDGACGTSLPAGGPAGSQNVPAGSEGAEGFEADGSVPVGGAAALDSDGDRIADEHDNCPTTPNTSQLDQDRDALGDACDPDLENDGVTQVDALGRLLDNCPFTFNPDQAFVCRGDIDGDGIPDDVDDCVAYGPLGACADAADLERLAQILDARQPPGPAPVGPGPAHAADGQRPSAPWLVVGAVAAVALGAVAVAALRRRRE